MVRDNNLKEESHSQYYANKNNISGNVSILNITESYSLIFL